MSPRFCRPRAKFRLHLQDQVVLVQLREQRRNLPLAEAVVERVIETLGREAEARRRRPVDLQRHLTAVVLQIARDVLELGQAPQAIDELTAYCANSAALGSCMLNWYSVRLTISSTDDVLDGLHVEADAVHWRGGAGELADDVRDRFALAQGLEIDLDAAAVERRIGAVDADERGQALHRRILENHRRQAAAAAAPSWRTTRFGSPRKPLESHPCPGRGRIPSGSSR